MQLIIINFIIIICHSNSIAESEDREEAKFIKDKKSENFMNTLLIPCKIFLLIGGIFCLVLSLWNHLIYYDWERTILNDIIIDSVFFITSAFAIWLHLAPQHYEYTLLCIFAYGVLWVPWLNLAPGHYKPNIYMLPAIEFAFWIANVMPNQWKNMTLIYHVVFIGFTLVSYYIENEIPEGLLFWTIACPVYFAARKRYQCRNTEVLYKLMYKYKKSGEEKKKIFEVFPHGVLIHTDNSEDPLCFTNNEFKSQIQDIRNKVRELHNIEVRYNEEGEKNCDIESETTTDLYKFFHQTITKTSSSEISERHKIKIKSSPGEYKGSMLDFNNDTEIENIYSIKTMKVEWEGKSCWMHVLIDTSIIMKLEDANNNIKWQKIMFASASHEFRTPLNAIINCHQILGNYVDMLDNIVEDKNNKSKVCNNFSIQEYKRVISRFNHTLKMSHNSSRILLGLVEDILDLTKMEAGTFALNFTTFEVSQIVVEVNEFFQDQCDQKQIQLKWMIDDKLEGVEINSDRNRLRQVLMNLMTNSVKFTFQGFIKISASLNRDDEQTFVEFSIEDSGIGIKDEDQAKLFKLFGMASGNRGINPNGWGLGLTVWQKFIESLGGSISLKSEYGKGTKITLKLPIETINKTLANSEDKSIFDTFESNFDSMFFVEHSSNEDFLTSRKISFGWMSGAKKLNF